MQNHLPTIVKKAEFNPDVRKYWLLSGTLILFVTIAGIPLILIWYLFGMWITGRYLARLECVLTEKTLVVRKGILNRVEKTVPLDKITDLGMIQGPVMRIWGLHAISVETAGQSGPGALIKLYGIQGAEEFRDEVLQQRDVMLASSGKTGAVQNVDGSPEESVALLREIRDSLKVMAERSDG